MGLVVDGWLSRLGGRLWLLGGVAEAGRQRVQKEKGKGKGVSVVAFVHSVDGAGGRQGRTHDTRSTEPRSTDNVNGAKPSAQLPQVSGPQPTQLGREMGGRSEERGEQLYNRIGAGYRARGEGAEAEGHWLIRSAKPHHTRPPY